MELDVLCEIHDREELERAVALGFTVIGVNSRNLHTMQVDPQTQIDLAQLLPRRLCAWPRAASARCRHCADDGGGFRRVPDRRVADAPARPGRGTGGLLVREYSARELRRLRMWVKICGNTNLEDAALAAELGADAVGFVFAESKRRVTAAQVAAITPHLRAGVERVGVFHSHDAEEIARPRWRRA